jgi:hypothetical protein
MQRIDTLRAISAICRGSHASALLALGWLVLDQPTEVLEDLLTALQETGQHQELLDHLERHGALQRERYGTSSRLD